MRSRTCAWLAGIVPFIAGASGLSACAATTTSITPTTGTSSATTSSTHSRVTAPATAGNLPIGTAPANAVQPQPPPGSCTARGSGLFSLPDPHCTPGAIDPAVTQQNIDSTICQEGYTDTVRPPESITEPEKRASLAAYGDQGALRDYEYDHLVPLELGGASNDPRNLWPEPGRSPNPKDSLERRLADLVCERQITLAYAQRLIARNWVAAYDRYVSNGGSGG